MPTIFENNFHNVFFTEDLEIILRSTKDLPKLFSYKKITVKVLRDYLNRKRKLITGEEDNAQLTEKVKQVWVGISICCLC